MSPHAQGTPQQTEGRHVFRADRAGKIPDSLLQQIKNPPSPKRHHRVESLSTTPQEERDESLSNLEDGDFNFKQT